jgi:multisubunit Na+/H+ antiporter MnhB subunit
VSSVSSPGSSASNRKPLAIALGVLAVVFIVVGLIFAIKGHHELRTTGGFIAGIVCAGGAWVALAYKPKPKAAAPSNVENTPAGRH